MAIICFRAYQGKVAVWEKPTSGDPMAPFNNPTEHMDLVRFHSDLQYLSNSIVQDVTISHTALAGSIGTGYTVANDGGSSGSSQPITDGQIRASTINLLAHGLPYVPLYYVLYNQQLVAPGFPVQVFDDRIRTISASATSNYIRLRELAVSSDQTLPAITRNYRVLVFRDPLPDPAKPLYHYKADSLIMGHGKVDTAHRNIRKATGGYDFYVPVKPIADTRNGAIKIIAPNGDEASIGQYTGSFFETETVTVSY